MKKTLRRLTLSRETLLRLDASKLKQAAGGNPTSTPPQCHADTVYPCASVDVCTSNTAARCYPQ